jgi:hypothetical protein
VTATAPPAAARGVYDWPMFETDVSDVAEWVVADLVVSAVDQAGGSPRRWFLLLGTALVGALAVLWFVRRAAAEAEVPDSGAGSPNPHAS